MPEAQHNGEDAFLSPAGVYALAAPNFGITCFGALGVGRRLLRVDGRKSTPMTQTGPIFTGFSMHTIPVCY
jgi:hypothetical protein